MRYLQFQFEEFGEDYNNNDSIFRKGGTNEQGRGALSFSVNVQTALTKSRRRCSTSRSPKET